MNRVFTMSLVIVGLINFAPIIGILGSKELESTYGLSLLSDDLLILLQHRALLFGLLGGFILYSAYNPLYQTAAIVMAAISMVGFALIFHTLESGSPALTKVLYFDYVGIFFLTIAIIIKYGFNNN